MRMLFAILLAGLLAGCVASASVTTFEARFPADDGPPPKAERGHRR